MYETVLIFLFPYLCLLHIVVPQFLFDSTCKKVEVWLQLPCFKMTLIGMPDARALLVEADLVLWGLKMLVSIPKFLKISLTHLAMMSFEAHLCGLPYVNKSC